MARPSVHCSCVCVHVLQPAQCHDLIFQSCTHNTIMRKKKPLIVDVVLGLDADTHFHVEAKQVADDPRHCRQDHHLRDAVQERVHGEAIKPERGIQFLMDRGR